jgi:uncharacterized protein
MVLSRQGIQTRWSGAVAAAALALAGASGSRAGELVISEYLEGSQTNKALELFNGRSRAVDLAAGGYVLQIYYNGSAAPGDTIPLPGAVAAGGAYVVCHTGAVAEIRARANLVSAGLKFNGDDALVLRAGGTNGPVVDSFGRVGEDPGTCWGSGTNRTADATLRRRRWVTQGDRNPSDAFDPASEWEAWPCDACDGLGAHAMQPEPSGTLLRVGGRGLRARLPAACCLRPSH